MNTLLSILVPAYDASLLRFCVAEDVVVCSCSDTLL